MFSAPTQGSLGISPTTEQVRVIARGRSFLKGEVGQFDLAMSSPHTTNNRAGNENSGLVNVVAVGAAGVIAGLLCVFLEDTPENQRGYAAIKSGEVDMYAGKAAGNIARDDPLIAVAGAQYLTGTLAADSRIVACALEAKTAPSTPTLCKCRFDGINGLATKAT